MRGWSDQRTWWVSGCGGCLRGAFRLWRDVRRIDGYTNRRGLRDEAFSRPAPALRNFEAMVELLYGSGLRVQEAGSLLATEVPPPGPAGAFNEAHLPASIAKGGRSRVFYVLDDALALVNSYIATSRPRGGRACPEVGQV